MNDEEIMKNNESSHAQNEESTLDEEVIRFDNTHSFTFNIPKIKNEGEDAEPFCLIEDDYVILAAFDGLGGAGSQPITINKETKSSAYFASRIVRGCFDNFFPQSLDLTKQKGEEDFDTRVRNLITIDLKEYIKKGLDDFLKKNSVPQSRLKSSLIKSIPTTLASVFIVKTTNNSIVRCYSFWAGDSRVYRLDPISGLQQMTEDDLKQQGDAFENLRNDAKMSNFITPDLDFKLNFRSYDLKVPSIFFACTDGCFDFLPTPMHFEFMLLKTMQTSNTLEDWSNKIEDYLNNIPVGDDCSLSLWFHGFDSFQAVKESFSQRLLGVIQQVTPIEKLREDAKGIRQDIKSLDEMIDRIIGEKLEPENKLKDKEKDILNLSRNIWENYKKNYYIKGDNIENVNS